MLETRLALLDEVLSAHAGALDADFEESKPCVSRRQLLLGSDIDEHVQCRETESAGERSRPSPGRSAGVRDAAWRTGDYECPHCGRAYPNCQGGPTATRAAGSASCSGTSRSARCIRTPQHAAEAAEAAGAQGRFWEMHDALFEHQRSLDDRHLVQYAQALELDDERLQMDLTPHTGCVTRFVRTWRCAGHRPGRFKSWRATRTW